MASKPIDSGERLPHQLDQCPYGATIDGGPILKATDIESDQPLASLERYCDQSHQHVQLRGSNAQGARTAQAAVYPDALCSAILEVVQQLATTNSGGMSWRLASMKGSPELIPSVNSSLATLYGLAGQQDRIEAWALIMTPWLRQYPQLHDPAGHWYRQQRYEK